KDNQVVVLGMRRDFEERAQVIFSNSLINFATPSTEIYEFLKLAVQEVKDRHSKEIDRPISLRVLNGEKLLRVRIDL
uniref:hypothetical protein n=1 Tax=Paracoccus sediminilitoris TaxID=2202419 RepID=UPI001F3A0A9A